MTLEQASTQGVCGLQIIWGRDVVDVGCRLDTRELLVKMPDGWAKPDFELSVQLTQVAAVRGLVKLAEELHDRAARDLVYWPREGLACRWCAVPMELGQKERMTGVAIRAGDVVTCPCCQRPSIVEGGKRPSLRAPSAEELQAIRDIEAAVEAMRRPGFSTPTSVL